MSPEVDKIIKRVQEGVIGYSCWVCKWRQSDDWNVEIGFCYYYPSLLERNILKGRICPYFEEGE